MPDCKFIPEPEAAEMLQKNGIPYPDFGFAKDSEEAAVIAAKIGYPVVVKIVAEGILHKSDIGGVQVNLSSKEAVIAACNKIETSFFSKLPNGKLSGMLICKQAELGIELIVGGLQDVMFGPCLMVGLGGIFTEILKDVSFRVVPLQKIDALEMLKELKGFPILKGARGNTSADLDALTDFMLKVSQFLENNPWIKELDLNPVSISGSRITVLDARIIG